MPNPDILPDEEDSDHIEPISQLRSTVSIHPNTGAPAEFPALPEVDRLERVSERVAPTRLHFHERDIVSASHDEVDVAMPATEAMRDELPSITSHPSGGDAFAQQPECLSLFRHGRTIWRVPESCVTRTVRAVSNKRLTACHGAPAI